MADWDVFQRDVLDVLRQYEGYFDFFERVGSLGDDSRPDCFARVSREDKKEIWVLDAKNKPEIDSGDRERMEKYLEMLQANPIDIGLELSELSDYEFRGIFITSSGELDPEGYEQVPFSALHQFLQRELVYTDTDRVVRDVAKMVERKQLSQSQARLLFRSLKPFEERVQLAMDTLEEIETRFVGLELQKPPISSYDFDLPVDAVLRHVERDQVFLFDIPYSPDAVKEVDSKVEEVKKRLSKLDKEVYYAAIDTFETGSGSEYVLAPGEVEDEVKETAGIVSPDEVVELFTPKIPVEKEYGDDYVEVRDSLGIGYRARVATTDDITHTVEAVLPKDAASQLKETMMNSREIGDVENGGFRQELEVTQGLEAVYTGTREPFENYKESMKSIYQSSVNPVLGKKVSKTA
ncbi:MAG: hypothetical protein ABEI58_03660 [Candidatus Nanohaloarchaea archaeon]